MKQGLACAKTLSLMEGQWLVPIVVYLLAVTVVGVMENVPIYFSRQYVIDDVSTRVFRNQFGVTMDNCKHQCYYTKNCSLVNYHSHANLCFLIEQLDTQLPAMMNISSVYISSDLSASKSEMDPCTNCSDYEDCSDSTCRPKGCPPPGQSVGIQTYGNLFFTGSRLMHRCNDSFQSGPGSVNYSMCLSDGTWTQYTLTCCPKPASPFETGTLPDGTKVTYFLSTTRMTRDEAAEYCTSLCSRLLLMLTYEKFIFFRDVMNRDDSHDYWLDGQRYNTSSPWLASTGETLPPTNNTAIWWKSDKSEKKLCVRAYKNKDYRWKTQDCTHMYMFICEQ